MVYRKLISLIITGILLFGAAFAQLEGSVSFYHTDHLGSVRLITDRERQTLFSTDYLPFGEEPGTAIASEKKFTGHYRDGETGVDYAGARYLPVAARAFPVRRPHTR